MGKLKKFFAVVLCCALSIQGLGVFGAGSAANIQERLSYSEIAVALGLLDADIMGRLDSNITRGELTAAIARMRGIEGDGESGFADVPTTHPYAKWISAAQKQGLINGFGDGTFRPDEEATYAQALKLCVYLAGYGGLIEGGMSAESAAVKIKLFSKLRVSAPPAIKVSEAAELLVKSGEIEMLELGSISENRTEYEQNGRTVFSAYLDIYKQDGIIAANGNTGIYEEISIDDDMVMLEEEIMTDLSGSAGELLGYNVTAYVRREAGSDPQLLYAYANNKNEITKIPALKIEDFNNGTISFENKNGKFEQITFKVSSVATIYNGVLIQVPSLTDFEVKNGSITLIDNDNDGKIDVVNIEKYDNCIVDSIDKVHNEIWFKYGAAPIKLDDLENVTFLSSDGQAVDLRELVEWDVVSVARSKNDEVVKVIYILGEVEGEVSAMYSPQDAQIDIDGVTYDIADVFMDNLYAEMYVGKKANFYFDIDGKIASYNLSSDGEEYAYLVAVDMGKGLHKQQLIKIMDSYGNVSILNLADKVEMDEVDYNLNNSADRDTLEALGAQLVLIKRNDAGEINYIDRADIGGGELKRIFEPAKMNYRKSSMMFFDNGKKYLAVTNSTIHMYVPEPSKAKNADDDAFYTYSMSQIGEDAKKIIAGYSRGDSIIAEVIFETHNPESGVGFEEDFPVCVVDEIVNARNSRGEWAYKISVYSGGKKNTYFTESEDVFQGFAPGSKNYYPHKGDIVKLKTNRYGEVRGIKVVYSTQQDKIDTTYSYPNNNLAYYRIQMAYAYKKDKNFLETVAINPMREDFESIEDKVFEIKNMNTFKIYVYDSKEDTLTVGSGESIRDFIGTNGTEASKLFMYERNGIPREMCIYR